MHTGIINFASRTALNIKSTDVKKEILDTVENLCQVKIIQKHFEKFDKNSFSKLNKSPHLVSLRTNGNPYYLMLCSYNFVNQCIFIDKKVQNGYFVPRMIIAKFEFDDELFENTLFDGEMLKNDKNEWIYIINDVIAYKNEHLDKLNFLKRLTLINNIMNNNYRADKNDICNLQIKKYVTYDKIKPLVEEILPKLAYTCRGLYFKPLYLKFRDILYNFDDSLITSVKKIKYQSDGEFFTNKIDINSINSSKNNSDAGINDFSKLNTEVQRRFSKEQKILTKENSRESIISNNSLVFKQSSSNNSSNNSEIDDNDSFDVNKEFLVEKTDLPDVYNLYDINTSKKKGIACIPYLSTSKNLLNIFKDINFNNKLKMECKYSPYFKKWIPINVVIQ
jgi:hypothetical protein